MSEQLSQDLVALLGEEGFVALTEAFGGRRLYVPREITPDHEIAKALGTPEARKLSGYYAGAQLRIPLARELRARHYRASGLSNGRIATKLGITEGGVDKLFARMDRPPEKGSAQLSLPI